MNHTCGIDWASDHHDVSIVNEHGMEVKQLRIEDTLEGYQELLGVLKTLGGDIPVAIECKEHLLISFLVGEGYTVYPINPKSAERYKDRSLSARCSTAPGPGSIMIGNDRRGRDITRHADCLPSSGCASYFDYGNTVSDIAKKSTLAI